jgi:hypothetical protein
VIRAPSDSSGPKVIVPRMMRGLPVEVMRGMLRVVTVVKGRSGGLGIGMDVDGLESEEEGRRD